MALFIYQNKNNNQLYSSADATSGVVSMSLTQTRQANLEEGRYVYDLEILQTSSSTITRVIEGIINVRPQVSI